MYHVEFVDSEAMSRQHPGSWHHPPKEELDSIPSGTSVYVAIGGERFWVQVESNKLGVIVGQVNNAVMNTHIHGLSSTSRVRLEHRHVLGVEGNYDPRSACAVG